MLRKLRSGKEDAAERRRTTLYDRALAEIVGVRWLLVNVLQPWRREKR